MSENILTLTKSSFDSEIKKDGPPILVDFWAEWCGPCRIVTPVLEQLARDYSGRIRIGKVNVDEETSVAEKFGVQSIPTLLLFKGGRVVDQQVGAVPRDVLAKMFDKHLGPS